MNQKHQATHRELMVELADVLACDGLLQEDGPVQALREGDSLALVVPYGGAVFVLRAEKLEGVPPTALPLASLPAEGTHPRRRVRSPNR
jgi:hypothetical protein